MVTAPDRGEAAAYYFTYIDKVPPGDIRRVLTEQAGEATTLLRGISEERSRHRYAPGKWSIRDVLAHVNDGERVFSHRALWFARGFETPLPSFDQEIASATAHADARTWGSLVDEFVAVRAATVAFFDSLDDAAWDRRGIASDKPFTVRALAYVCAGHLTHHIGILKEKYL
jgi:hypothetical protein